MVTNTGGLRCCPSHQKIDVVVVALYTLHDTKGVQLYV